ncbi:hypothetical protein ACJJTC_018460 [Scirpophaga incertulas]
MATFTDENDEFLVELIAKNPPLYDSRLKTYKDNIVRDNIWEYIASKLNKTSEDCRKRWKCIRDSYQRIKRKNKLPTGSAAGSKSKKWPLIERLTFLENVPTERKTVCNIERANDIYDSENEVSNNNETCFNKENVEPNEIELNSEETSGNVIDSAPSRSGTVMVNASSSAIEVDVEEPASDEKQNKKARSRESVLKKKKQSQNSTMQAALLNLLRFEFECRLDFTIRIK